LNRKYIFGIKKTVLTLFRMGEGGVYNLT